MTSNHQIDKKLRSVLDSKRDFNKYVDNKTNKRNKSLGIMKKLF